MTTTSSSSTRPEPTYGGFLTPRRSGLFGLGYAATYAGLGAMLVTIVAYALGARFLALALALAALVVLAASALRDSHGRSVLDHALSAAGWARARRAGAHLYRSGPLARTPWGTFAPPGLLTDTRLAEHLDSYGRPFALLYVPATGDSVVVLATEPDGASLVDGERLDAWVAEWGGWVADLGSEPGVVAAAVTIEAAPDTGARLRREVTVNTDPDAHPVAQAVLRRTAETYPAGSASLRAWVALTVAPQVRAGARERTREEVARDLAARLPGLTASLAATGAGAARPCTARDLCETVRVAFDPDTARLLDAARVHRQAGQADPADDVELRWPDVGPVDAVEARDHYRHDGAVSCSWLMSTPPRGEVYARVLSGLLSASPAIDRKRVTLLYGPRDPAASARLAEADVRATKFRVTASTNPSERALADRDRARQAAREEARGAALVDLGALVTATVYAAPHVRSSPEEEWRNPEELLALRVADARAAVDNLGTAARLLLRPAYGHQAGAFTAALPLGLSLPRYQALPAALKDAL